MLAAEILGQIPEALIEEAEQRTEGLLVPRVRCGCNQNQMAGLLRCRQTRDELVPLMPTTAAFAAVRARVRFIDNHEFRAGAKKVSPAAVALDEIDRYDDERINIKERFTDAAVLFEARHGARQDQFGINVEFVAHFGLPLFGELGRTEDGDTLDLATVEKLAGDQTCLDGFSDSDVVGDKETNRIKLQRHQQRH